MDRLRLNLGCGAFPRAGYTNVDWSPAAKADVRHDLSAIPYPFPADTAEEIVADHVLEHLPNPFEAVAEWNRLLEPGGRLVVRDPHFSRGFMHPEHRVGFDVTFPLYFDPSFPGGFCGTVLGCERRRLRWFAQPWLNRQVLSRPRFLLATLLGRLIDLAANLSPEATSRLWCFWVRWMPRSTGPK